MVYPGDGIFFTSLFSFHLHPNSAARLCLVIRSLSTSRLAGPALVFALATTLPAGSAHAQTTILSRQPARNAVAASRTGPVNIVFSQAIAPGTAAGLRVYGSARRGLRPGTLAGGGSNTFSPAPGFAPGESISVSVPASLTSTGGTPVSRQVYQFTAATGGPGRGFFLDTAVVGNTTSRDQLLADMDNDGDLDLITTGGLYGCRVFGNDGTGHFSFLSGVVAAQEPGGVALADVNQDGFLDALIADFAGATVAVCLNDGYGTLIGITGTATSSITSQNVLVGTQPVAVAAGDLDGDGDQDFVTANAGDNTATIWFNNGVYPLFYTSRATVAMGSTPSDVALADVDSDGDLDLLVSNAGSPAAPASSVSVRLNAGNGTFGPVATVAVGLRPSALALADVDGDGGQTASTASIRFNDGSGHFSYTRDERVPLDYGFSLGDLDNDGDLDMVMYSTFDRALRFNDGHGHFSTVGPAPTTSLHLSAQALGDMDGDGDLDLVVTLINGDIETFLNNGNGTFAAAIVGGVPNGAEYLMLGDLDADGDLDAVVMGYDSNYQVAMNNGQGGLVYAYEVSLNRNSVIPACSLNDFDGDGDLDLLYFYRQSNTLQLALNAFSLATASARRATTAVALYPNPAHGQFRLQVPAALRPAASTALPLRLYNALGQLVWVQSAVFSASGEATVNVAQLPAGLYTLRVELQSGPVVLRVAVE